MMVLDLNVLSSSTVLFDEILSLVFYLSVSRYQVTCVENWRFFLGW